MGTGPGGQKQNVRIAVRYIYHFKVRRRGLNDELSCNMCGLYCKLVSFYRFFLICDE
ncbi:hypothetical protein K435DRAFT_668714 [Dendrothele bispora CBS 962.96]|uniref:Uncharacterized protein n=1 Tax=Dendrothele bispora (strain CBS 962.96) TaxID=1314807 RepID=A0A4S8LX49_DENBC|nr:hypothetical protein K435DRAFT_668714 [Dendrothele bispora CBS 962.96]